MLNLLIAIISDCYINVSISNRQNKNYEIANLLLEIDVGMDPNELEEATSTYLFIS